MKIPIRNLYFMLCYAWGHAEEAEDVSISDAGRFERIHDLFGWVLGEGVFRLARRGIDRSYVEHRQAIPGIRGRLELAPTIGQALLPRGRAVCTFEELDIDVIHNQVIRTTLTRLLRWPDLAPEIRSHVAAARDRLSGVSEIPLTSATFTRIHLDRNRRVYRFLVSVCRLLHECHLVNPRTGATRFKAISTQRLRQWQVFEEFVGAFFDKEAEGYRVHGKKRFQWHALEVAPGSEGRVPGMETDVEMEAVGRRRIILDTKFYTKALSAQFGVSRLHSGHLYQLFAYIINRQAENPHGPRYEGILLYPVVDRAFQFEFRTHGHRIQARSVDLGVPWQQVRDELLGIVDSA
jgi:5-methylcytosine-specific restriction enzyme subunit McrC